MSEQQILAKCAWRLIPFITLLYLVNYIDRVNVGFAALTMNQDLGFTPSQFGLGAGIFFVSYALAQVPAALIVARVGPRRGTCFVLMAWGAISAANAFIFSPESFYALRFALGVAEAGFFPSMIFYLSMWFPKAYLARSVGFFMAANPLAVFVGAPVSGLILRLDGVLSLHGWQWLFLLEGLPACLLAFAVYRLLPDAPQHASWLKPEEKDVVCRRLEAEGATAEHNFSSVLSDLRVYAIGLAGACYLGCQYGVQLWAPQMVQAVGFSNTAVGFVLAVPSVLAAVAMVLWGYSSDIRGERIWHAVLAAFFTAVGLIVAGLSDSTAGVLFGLTIAIIGQFAILPVMNSLAASFLRGPALAGGIAFYNMISQLGGSAGPPLIGTLKEQTGDYGAGLFALAFAMVVAGLVVLGLGRAMTPAPRQASPVDEIA